MWIQCTCCTSRCLPRGPRRSFVIGHPQRSEHRPAECRCHPLLVWPTDLVAASIYRVRRRDRCHRLPLKQTGGRVQQGAFGQGLRWPLQAGRARVPPGRAAAADADAWVVLCATRYRCCARMAAVCDLNRSHARLAVALTIGFEEPRFTESFGDSSPTFSRRSPPKKSAARAGHIQTGIKGNFAARESALGRSAAECTRAHASDTRASATGRIRHQLNETVAGASCKTPTSLASPRPRHRLGTAACNPLPTRSP